MGIEFFIYAHVSRDTTRVHNKALVYRGCSLRNRGFISGKDTNPHHPLCQDLTLVTHGVHGYEGALSAGSESLDWKLSISLFHPPTHQSSCCNTAKEQLYL